MLEFASDGTSRSEALSATHPHCYLAVNSEFAGSLPRHRPGQPELLAAADRSEVRHRTATLRRQRLGRVLLPASTHDEEEADHDSAEKHTRIVSSGAHNAGVLQPKPRCTEIL